MFDHGLLASFLVLPPAFSRSAVASATLALTPALSGAALSQDKPRNLATEDFYLVDKHYGSSGASAVCVYVQRL